MALIGKLLFHHCHQTRLANASDVDESAGCSSCLPLQIPLIRKMYVKSSTIGECQKFLLSSFLKTASIAL